MLKFNLLTLPKYIYIYFILGVSSFICIYYSIYWYQIYSLEKTDDYSQSLNHYQLNQKYIFGKNHYLESALLSDIKWLGFIKENKKNKKIKKEAIIVRYSGKLHFIDINSLISSEFLYIESFNEKGVYLSNSKDKKVTISWETESLK